MTDHLEALVAESRAANRTIGAGIIILVMAVCGLIGWHLASLLTDPPDCKLSAISGAIPSNAMAKLDRCRDDLAAAEYAFNQSMMRIQGQDESLVAAAGFIQECVGMVDQRGSRR